MTSRAPQRGHLFSFYLPSLNDSDRVVELDGDEFHHLARILRLTAGEAIVLVDGVGGQALAEVESIGKTAARVRVVAHAARVLPRLRVVLALPLIARAAFEDAITHCVEAGVTEIIPVTTELCKSHAWSDATAERARRVAVAAMKQSGRAWLPPVADAVSLEDLVRKAPSFGRFVVADANATLGPEPAVVDTLALVGPEAGLTQSELEGLDAAGADRVLLSYHRLRAETAALVLMARLLAPTPPGTPAV